MLDKGFLCATHRVQLSVKHKLPAQIVCIANLILQGETEIVDLITLKMNEKNLNNILN